MVMAKSEATNRSILVVDDEANLVELFSMFLEDQYNVRTAYGGNEAMEKVDASIDVALLDRRMPNVSGDDVAEYIYENGFDFSVAMITAVEPSSDIFDLPIDDYVKKPVGRDDLLSLVDILLKRQAYDEKSNRFFQLAAKKAAFEASELDNLADEDKRKYQEVITEMQQLQSDINGTLNSLSEDQLQMTYRDL